MRIILYTLLALLGVGSLVPLPAATKTYSNRSGARPSDAEIDQTIRAHLAKSKIGKDGFKAHVKAGVVTWEGHTGIPQHKGAATRMAHAAGAAQVVNNIQVDGGSSVGHPVRKAEVKSE